MPDRPVEKVIEKKPFVMVPSDLSVCDAACRLKEQRDEGAVLVVEKGILVGICTERDIVFKVVATGCDPAATQVAEIMTAEPVTITADKPFAHALHMMFEGGFRHVPVVNDAGEPIGLVSARDALGLDVLHFEEDLLLREGLSEVM
ncbi:MAG: CBS domain-containing protein [Zoogloeaceae bacterium]|nr:CBS domain-containing protein [Rhodocyclaceae bacterium]MCP5236748.1 CBS domain-containing protein [Zoogloeaceae bacterium]